MKRQQFLKMLAAVPFLGWLKPKTWYARQTVTVHGSPVPDGNVLDGVSFGGNGVLYIGDDWDTLDLGEDAYRMVLVTGNYTDATVTYRDSEGIPINVVNVL